MTAKRHSMSASAGVFVSMALRALLQVFLHRSDALTTVIVVDKELRVARADDAAGLMFGVSAKWLVHKRLAG
jgi:nitrogen-specific signal transduction histidine kinase